MQLLDLVWPYKLAQTGEVRICEFAFWDSGATASQQYKYIQTTPAQHAACCLYIVSCLERNSWVATKKKLEEDRESKIAKMVILTKSVWRQEEMLWICEHDLTRMLAVRCLPTLRIDERSKREVHESDILAFQETYNAEHFPPAEDSLTTVGSPSASPSGGLSRSAYPAGSLVVCKLANWPISNELFFTRPVRSERATMGGGGGSKGHVGEADVQWCVCDGSVCTGCVLAAEHPRRDVPRRTLASRSGDGGPLRGRPPAAGSSRDDPPGGWPPSAVYDRARVDVASSACVGAGRSRRQRARQLWRLSSLGASGRLQSSAASECTQQQPRERVCRSSSIRSLLREVPAAARALPPLRASSPQPERCSRASDSRSSSSSGDAAPPTQQARRPSVAAEHPARARRDEATGGVPPGVASAAAAAAAAATSRREVDPAASSDEGGGDTARHRSWEGRRRDQAARGQQRAANCSTEAATARAAAIHAEIDARKGCSEFDRRHVDAAAAAEHSTVAAVSVQDAPHAARSSRSAPVTLSLVRQNRAQRASALASSVLLFEPC
jgi:hypothetical protein